MEGRYIVKIGTQPNNPPAVGATWTRAAGAWTAAGGAAQTTQSRIICLTSTATAPATANGTNYQLNGAVDLPTGSRVISAVLVNVTSNEAREVSMRIDGESATQALGAADSAGKVVYAAPNAAGLTTVYIYIAHQ